MPLSAGDFTPYAERAKQQNADLLFVAWAGTTGPRSGAPSASRASRARCNRHRPRRAGDVELVRPGHQLPLALRLQRAEEPGQRLAGQEDEAAQPAARHLHAGRLRGRADDRPRGAEGRRRGRRQDDQGARGLEVPGPKGPQRIRPEDHAMLQPMFQVRLRTVKGKQVPVPVKTFSPGNVQPPVRPFSELTASTLQPRGTHPGDAEPRARHRRRDHRRRCRPGGPCGRVPGDHRPERSRQDLALQPAVGPLPADARDDRDRRPRRHQDRPTGERRPGWGGRSRSRASFRG